MRTKTNETFPAIMVTSMLVGFLWFLLTDAVWQFLPILVAIGVGLMIRKAIRRVT